MTEFELVYLIVERRSELIKLIQWWGAISFGVIATTHFLDRTINLFIVTLIIVFYAAFSIFVIRMNTALSDQLLTAFVDLATYTEYAESVSSQAHAMIGILANNRLSISFNFIEFVLWGLSIAACSYPLWQYIRLHKYKKTPHSKDNFLQDVMTEKTDKE